MRSWGRMNERKPQKEKRARDWRKNTMKLNHKNEPLKLNIQFFAEEPGDDPQKGGEPDPANKDKPTEPVTLTADELQKKIEAESDRKLASALKKKEDEWKTQQQAAIDAALAEKERLSKLSEKERKDEELSKREQELQDRMNEIQRKELKADAVADLSDKGLPSSFADFVLAEDAEKTLGNINKLKETFDAAVNEAVKGRLRQDDPKTGGGLKKSAQTSDVMELARSKRIIK